MTWDESKHPRNPHTGEFTEKAGGWVQAVSDAIDRISDEHGGALPREYGDVGPLTLSDLPADGYRETARFWAVRGLDRDHEYGSLGSEFEVWDPLIETWRDGSQSFSSGSPDGDWFEFTLADPHPEMQGWPVLDRTDFSRSTHVHVRSASHAPTSRAVDMSVETPDPDWEYNAKGVWVAGTNLNVTPPGPGNDEQMWTVNSTPYSRLTGTMLWHDRHIQGRPRMLPNQHFWEHARRHPNDRLAAFHQAKVFPAQDLADNPQYASGGWQIFGPDGLWHTIEEVYQNYAVTEHGGEPVESLELIADGWHEPDLDTSEEITVRPRPLEW